MRLTELSDEELALRARGEPRAPFEVLFGRYKVALWNFILRQGIEEDRAQDAFQATFLKAYRSISGFREEATFKTWLYTIAKNAVTDELRSAGKGGRILPLREGAQIEDRGVHEDVRRAEAAERAKEALGRLPSDERQLFTLVRFQGLTIPEAARVVGLSHSAARMKLFRVRKRIGQELSLQRENT